MSCSHPSPLIISFVETVFSRAGLKMALETRKTLSLEKQRKVVFIHSEELVTLCDKLPRVSGRVRSQFVSKVSAVLHSLAFRSL